MSLFRHTDFTPTNLFTGTLYPNLRRGLVHWFLQFKLDTNIIRKIVNEQLIPNLDYFTEFVRIFYPRNVYKLVHIGDEIIIVTNFIQPKKHLMNVITRSGYAGSQFYSNQLAKKYNNYSQLWTNAPQMLDINILLTQPNLQLDYWHVFFRRHLFLMEDSYKVINKRLLDFYTRLKLLA